MKKDGETSLESLIASHLYQEYIHFKEYLPKSICIGCKINMEQQSPSEFQAMVDYNVLIENVIKASNTNTGDSKCTSEICRLGSASINSDKSPFLLEKNKPTVAPPKPRITDFFSDQKHASKQEQIDRIIEETDSDSLEQLVSSYLSKKEKDSDNILYLKVN